MIERIHSPKQLELLPQSGTEAQKIRALFNAYGCGYDFCRFFRHGGTYLAALDGSFVIALSLRKSLDSCGCMASPTCSALKK